MSLAVDKIVQQAQRIKGKWQGRKRRRVKGAPLAGENRETGLLRTSARTALMGPRMPRIVRAAGRQPVKPMSVTDAARQIEANGEGIVVFRDAGTSIISVLYRRTNGELLLVETEQ